LAIDEIIVYHRPANEGFEVRISGSVPDRIGKREPMVYRDVWDGEFPFSILIASMMESMAASAARRTAWRVNLRRGYRIRRPKDTIDKLVYGPKREARSWKFVDRKLSPR
jgi:hypothetical protein